MERARALLKDETVEHRNEILKAINPLHVISRVSQLTVAKSRGKSVAMSITDPKNRIELSVAQSKVLLQSEQDKSESLLGQHMSHLMTRNTELLDMP